MGDIKRSAWALASLALLVSLTATAATINVPGDHATIQAAINAASPGDTILIGAGTYAERLTVNKQGLTLQGDGSYPRVRPELNPASKYDSVITVSAHHVTIRGLDISNAGGVVDAGESGTHIEHTGIWHGTWSPPFPEHLTVDDCRLHNTTHGVRWYGNGLVVINSEFTALGRKGITVSHDTGAPKQLTILNNRFYDFTPTWRQNAAIMIKYRDWYGVIEGNTMTGMRFGLAIHNGGTRHGNQLVFRNNIIEDLHSAGVNEGNEWGIDFYNACDHIDASNTVITCNRITGANYGLVSLRATPYMADNCIYGNNNGIWFSAGAGVVLDVTGNWWGHESGPNHDTNPGGTGNRIVGAQVLFDPWLSAAPACCQLAPPRIPGDVNGDGVVDLLDVMLVYQAVLGLVALTPEQLAAADVNCDGVVDLTDAQWIAEALICLRTLSACP